MIQSILRQSLIGGMLLALSGCMTFELEVGAVEEDEGMAAASTSETIHGSFWGFRWCDHVVEKCEAEGRGLYRVEYHTNALYTLASVLSLGLYVPQTVEWWCVVERRDDEDEEPFDPDAEKELEESE